MRPVDVIADWPANHNAASSITSVDRAVTRNCRRSGNGKLNTVTPSPASRRLRRSSRGSSTPAACNPGTTMTVRVEARAVPDGRYSRPTTAPWRVATEISVASTGCTRTGNQPRAATSRPDTSMTSASALTYGAAIHTRLAMAAMITTPTRTHRGINISGVVPRSE